VEESISALAARLAAAHAAHVRTLGPVTSSSITPSSTSAAADAGRDGAAGGAGGAEQGEWNSRGGKRYGGAVEWVSASPLSVCRVGVSAHSLRASSGIQRCKGLRIVN
jgi:hypothetical protein